MRRWLYTKHCCIQMTKSKQLWSRILILWFEGRPCIIVYTSIYTRDGVAMYYGTWLLEHHEILHTKIMLLRHSFTSISLYMYHFIILTDKNEHNIMSSWIFWFCHNFNFFPCPTQEKNLKPILYAHWSFILIHSILSEVT